MEASIPPMNHSRSDARRVAAWQDSPGRGSRAGVRWASEEPGPHCGLGALHLASAWVEHAPGNQRPGEIRATGFQNRGSPCGWGGGRRETDGMRDIGQCVEQRSSSFAVPAASVRLKTCRSQSTAPLRTCGWTVYPYRTASDFPARIATKRRVVKFYPGRDSGRQPAQRMA